MGHRRLSFWSTTGSDRSAVPNQSPLKTVVIPSSALSTSQWGHAPAPGPSSSAAVVRFNVFCRFCQSKALTLSIFPLINLLCTFSHFKRRWFLSVCTSCSARSPSLAKCQDWLRYDSHLYSAFGMFTFLLDNAQLQQVFKTQNHTDLK